MPREQRRRTNAEPMKPAPPVTSRRSWAHRFGVDELGIHLGHPPAGIHRPLGREGGGELVGGQQGLDRARIRPVALVVVAVRRSARK